MRIEYTKEVYPMRICELKQKEVINICDCRRLGYVGDVDFDMETGCLLAIIVPGPGCFCGFLVREKEFIIPFCDIRQVGPDIILVNVDLEKATERCGI
jgi:YlmC/YmxH family sporulation protein